MTTKNVAVEEQEVTQEVTQDADTQAAPETQEGLNLNDLSTLRAIIELASSRGVFKPTEMTAIGTAYNKLNNFLEQVAKQAEAESAGTE